METTQSNSTIESSIDDIRLESTQLFRSKLIGELSSAPRLSELDPKLLKVALNAAKDLDSQILTARRLDVENNNAQLDRDIALAIAKQSEQNTRTQGNPFLRSGANNPSEVDRTLLPTVERVAGEMDIGTSSETYSDFMVRIEGPAV
jgi:hypothetical protein